MDLKTKGLHRKTYLFHAPPESVWNDALQALVLKIGARVRANETLKSNPDIVRFVVTDVDTAAQELRR
ncbi:MAG: hypothetical protein WDA41_10710 [Candidatus Neomarinimicrobiota bacterium]